MRPLEDITVIALEHAVAAPLASARLADAGARVIKIERSEGDFARNYDGAVAGSSSYFVWLNRGKESLVLDLKNGEDISRLEQLVAAADVFIQGLAPGAAARLGFGADALRARYPRLITCDISGFGEDGPYSGHKAYDLLIQAETGLASITGSPEAPGRVGISICDITTGQSAYSAILEALLLREKTGKGSGLSIALFDVMAELMSVPLLHYDYGGKAPKRIGLAHPSIAPYGMFTTAIGDVVLAVQNEREWQALCRHFFEDDSLGVDERFATNNARVANRAELDALVAGRVAELDGEELERRLRAANVAYARINDVEALSQHPHLRRFEIELDGRRIKIPAPPARWSPEPAAARPRVPAIGEHGPLPAATPGLSCPAPTIARRSQ